MELTQSVDLFVGVCCCAGVNSCRFLASGSSFVSFDAHISDHWETFTESQKDQKEGSYCTLLVVLLHLLSFSLPCPLSVNLQVYIESYETKVETTVNQTYFPVCHWANKLATSPSYTEIAQHRRNGDPSLRWLCFILHWAKQQRLNAAPECDFI